MNRFKRAAIMALGTVALGFMMLSAATIGMIVLGVGAILALIGFIARPFMPKAPHETVIIDVEPLSSRID